MILAVLNNQHDGIVGNVMRLKWWELAFTMRKAEDALANYAKGIEKLAPLFFGASCLMLFIGVSLPIVKVSSLLIFTNSISIVSSIYLLWRSDEYFVAVIIVAFSIALPVAKIAVSDYVWRGCSLVQAQKGRSIGMLEWVGRWSMLDVLVIALIVVSLKASMLGDAKTEPGIYFFSASVLCSATGVTLIRRTLKRHSSPDVPLHPSS